MLFSFAVIALSAAIPETGKKHVPHTQTHMFDFGKLSDIKPMYRVTFLVVVLATFAQMIRMTVVSAMLPLRVETELGFSTTEVGALFGIIGVVNLIVMGPPGWIAISLAARLLLFQRPCSPQLLFSRIRWPAICGHSRRSPFS